jgi:hypothetical protein
MKNGVSRPLGRRQWTSVDAKVASPEGLEPPTSDLEGRCSIQLSYGLSKKLIFNKKPDSRSGFLIHFFGRGGGIRTHDHLVPNQVRYQAALRPEGSNYIPGEIGLVVPIMSCLETSMH